MDQLTARVDSYQIVSLWLAVIVQLPMGPLFWFDFRIQDIICKCIMVHTVTGSVLA